MIAYFIRGYCSILSPIEKKGKRYDLDTYFMTFKTYSFSSFKWIFDGFYPNATNSKQYLRGKKVVPVLIAEYLTPLAVLIMDDGEWPGSGGVRICTDSFTKQEKLATILKDKYGLKVTLNKKKNKDRFRLYIHKSSVRDILIPLIKNDIHPTMLYKLTLNFKYIFLFFSLNLFYPTKKINKVDTHGLYVIIGTSMLTVFD